MWFVGALVRAPADWPTTALVVAVTAAVFGAVAWIKRRAAAKLDEQLRELGGGAGEE